MKTLIRLLMIALGITAAVIMLQKNFSITTAELFGNFFRAIDDSLDSVASLVEPNIQSALRKIGFSVDLEPQWKYVFLLLLTPMRSIAIARSQVRTRTRGVVDYTWAIVCALFGAILAGAFPVSNNWGIVFSAITGITVFCLGYAVISLGRRGHEIAGAMLLLPFIGSQWVILGVVVLNLRNFGPSPGFAYLFVYILMIGISLLIVPLIQREGARSFSDWWQRETTSAGIDVLSVVGGAVALTLVGHWLA